MEISQISWTDGTVNPWIGCTKISDGCAHCYAENRDIRFSGGAHWGPNKPRQKTKDFIKNIRAFNRRAEAGKFIRCAACGIRRWSNDTCCEASSGIPARPIFFSLSLGDLFDPEVPHEWRAVAMAEYLDATNLDLMLLTKRMDLALGLMAQAAAIMTGRHREMMNAWLEGEAPQHIAIGTTVENSKPKVIDRLHHLADFPAVRRFISAEPLLSGGIAPHLRDFPRGTFHLAIAGAESLTQARPMHPAWHLEIERVCDDIGIPYHFKQNGEWMPSDLYGSTYPNVTFRGNSLVLNLDGAVRAPSDDGTLAMGERLMLRVGKKQSGHAVDRFGRTRTELLAFPLQKWQTEWWRTDRSGMLGDQCRYFPSLVSAQEWQTANPNKGGDLRRVDVV